MTYKIKFSKKEIEEFKRRKNISPALYREDKTNLLRKLMDEIEKQLNKEVNK